MNKPQSGWLNSIPWREATIGALLGLVLSTWVATTWAVELAGVSTPPVPLPETWSYRYTPASLLVLALVGSGFLGCGLFWSTERQLVNYFLLGCGMGFALLGTTYLAWEQVEVTQQQIRSRSNWGLSRVELRYAELQSLTEVHRHRPWGRPQGPAVYYQLRDGREGLLFDHRPRSQLKTWASLHLFQAAGRHGVEIRRAQNDPR